MVKSAVIQTGGKQYLVKENDEIYVDRLAGEKDSEIELETLAVITDGETVELGNPLLAGTAKVKILEQQKADKIRVARFKSKVRYRKVKGYRHQLSKIKILKI